MLIAVRAIQGIGAALLSPAALALLTVTFPAGRERNIALGVWGALAGIGGTLGVVAGGVLVDSRRLGVDLLRQRAGRRSPASSPRRVRHREPRAPARGLRRRRRRARHRRPARARLRRDPHRRGGLGLGRGARRCSAPPRSCSAAFVVRRVAREGPARAAAAVPRARPRASPRSRSRSTAARSSACSSSPRCTCSRCTATARWTRACTSCRWGSPRSPRRSIGAQLVTRFGTRAAYLGGSRGRRRRPAAAQPAPASDASYATDILPGLVVFGLGLPLVGVANQIAAVAEVPHEDAGAASGVITAAFQVGGALGLALISTAATTRVGDVARDRRVAARRAGRRLRARHARRRRASRSLNLLVGAVRAPRIKPDAALVAEAVAG